MSKLMIGAAALALVGSASAAEANAEWVLKGGEGSMVMITDSDQAPGMMINCNGGKLRVALTTEGVDLASLKESKRVRKADATVSIEGREPIETTLSYLPSRKLAVATQFSDKSKLYNAAVQGKTVSVDMGRRGSFTFTPPAINDTFKTFASSCAATNGS